MDETTDKIVDTLRAVQENAKATEEIIGQIITVLKDMEATHKDAINAIKELDKRVAKLEGRS